MSEKKSKEEIYFDNFGLYDKDVEENNEIEKRAQEEYSTNNFLEISYKNQPLLVYYKLIKGLLTPSKNHIATHAIVEGSVFYKRFIFKMISWSILPFLLTVLSILMLGTFFSGINSENIKINFDTTILFTLSFSLLLMFIILYSFLKAMMFTYIFNIRKNKKTELKKVFLMTSYWSSIFLVIAFSSWFLGLIVSLMSPLFGTSMSVLISIVSFFTCFFMYHKSIAYILSTKTYKTVLLNILFYVSIAFIIFFALN